MACAAAIATLDLFEKKKVLKTLAPKIKSLEKRLKEFLEVPCVGSIRQIGLMAGIEIFEDAEKKRHYPLARNISHKIIQRARERGVLLRPLGPVLVLMPPLSITEPELDKLCTVLYESITEETNT